jgi:hypothetical protein
LSAAGSTMLEERAGLLELASNYRTAISRLAP